jgi:chlorophyll synthase/bacteriochlorophyll c synthase
MCICGAIAAGASFDATDPYSLFLIVVGAIMMGPLATGFSQSINDYYDRELDAINDPSRPIPAGDVTLLEAKLNWIILAVVTLLVSFIYASPLITILIIAGLILGAIYSVPPIKLKKNVWLSAPAVGLGYVCMSWWAGHLIFDELTWHSVIMAIINGGIATGLLFLNDIKSVEGDRKYGLKSLPVMLGERRAMLVAFAFINGSQLALMILAFVWGHLWVAGLVLLAILIPAFSQLKLYNQPSHKNFMRYMWASNPFILAIQFVSAFVAGGYFG